MLCRSRMLVNAKMLRMSSSTIRPSCPPAPGRSGTAPRASAASARAACRPAVEEEGGLVEQPLGRADLPEGRPTAACRPSAGPSRPPARRLVGVDDHRQGGVAGLASDAARRSASVVMSGRSPSRRPGSRSASARGSASASSAARRRDVTRMLLAADRARRCRSRSSGSRPTTQQVLAPAADEVPDACRAAARATPAS